MAVWYVMVDQGTREEDSISIYDSHSPLAFVQHAETARDALGRLPLDIAESSSMSGIYTISIFHTVIAHGPHFDMS